MFSLGLCLSASDVGKRDELKSPAGPPRDFISNSCCWVKVKHWLGKHWLQMRCTQIALENVHTPPKTCIPSRFPIENVHTSEVENVHRGYARFQEILSVSGKFWVNIIPKWGIIAYLMAVFLKTCTPIENVHTLGKVPRKRAYIRVRKRGDHVF